MPQGTSTVGDGARYRVAGFFRRGAAAFVDGALLLPLVLLLGGASAIVAGQTLPALGELGPGYLVHLIIDGGTTGAVALAIGALVVGLYSIIFAAAGGQTPGQRVLGLRVIDGYGRSPTVLRATVRVVALALALALFGLGVLWIAFSREKRGLHDLLAGTWVVRVPRGSAEPARRAARPRRALGVELP
jgi:uncharacterized RDD family membrane protein YckC